MTTFTLPAGYTFEPEPTEGAGVLSDIPQMAEYGGATVTQAWDASGVHFVALCCKNPSGVFAFRVFREDAPESWREVPLPDFCDGRGSIGVSTFDGHMKYIAWRGAQFFSGVVPEAAGFAPVGAVPAPETAVDLWDKPYASQQELDGPPGEYVRINKLLAAVWQLRRLAKQAGWLR